MTSSLRLGLFRVLKAIKMKQLELAEAIGMHHVRLNQIICLRGSPARSWEIENICDYIGRPEAELFDIKFK